MMISSKSHKSVVKHRRALKGTPFELLNAGPTSLDVRVHSILSVFPPPPFFFFPPSFLFFLTCELVLFGFHFCVPFWLLGF